MPCATSVFLGSSRGLVSCFHTVEVTGSNPVAPTILRFRGLRASRLTFLTDNSTHSLRCARFVAVALSVEIQRRLNTTVTKDALHGLRLDLPLFTSQLESECRRLCIPKR